MDPKKRFNSPSAFVDLLSAALSLDRAGDISDNTVENQYKDALFVCFDFENGEEIKSSARSGDLTNGKVFAQGGMSIFDSWDIASIPSKAVLSTHNFAIGRSPSCKKKVDRRFLFGKTIWLNQLADLMTSMEKLLDRSRKIVLIGHGLGNDCHVLRSLGFDFQTSIIGYIDTVLVAQAIFGEPTKQSKRSGATSLRLNNVARKLGLILEGCHVAGNDANFTLRVMLLLFKEAHSMLNPSDEITMKTLERVKAIGLESLPPILPPLPRRSAKTSDMQGWIHYGHLAELTVVSHEIPEIHSDRTVLKAESKPSNTDSCEPSWLLLQWCPKINNRR
ncbi:Ribonuclease H-like protein [Glarea lozoyensis ATCC 20868]|uniref:Ribonuclease H-like protein n=1 Tax=Glarea lozoyensis (strain ATCC 20868 / MF5171) TaxID=1116229 RepID=S3DP19_GLAL2|nr:Ribonuclease H-like protein [Glarea lozoyensis ATCC 20868]EPE33821.1 Ribonuclease H-like protein [Glarea lozoyensis ATCC 20868]